MNVIPQLVRAELLKVRTTRTVVGILAGMAALLVLLVVVNVVAADKEDLKGTEGLRTILTIGGTGYVFALCLGVIGMAGEYRHGTIGHLFVAAPHRWQIVVAKVVSYAIAGAVFGALAVLLVFSIGAAGLSIKEVEVRMDGALPRRVAIGTVLACSLAAVIGVGLGALVKEQVIALMIGVGWTLVIDTFLSAAVPEVNKYFPGGAITGLLRQSTDQVLKQEIALLLLAGYATVFAALGTLVAQRRDLT